MRFARAVETEPFILFEGAVIERLRRSAAGALDPHVLHAGWVYDPAGRTVLEHVYRSYIDAGRDYDLPMVTLTPTWRADTERVARAGRGDVETINRDGFRFLNAIRDTYGDYASKLWIGGLMGCRGDAYRPEEALPAKEAHRFHTPQVRALARAGVDLIVGTTLPALSEAVGMARAMAEAGLPYVLSFVIRPTGALLDATPLHQAIAEIDASVSPRPTAYMVNCVHPSVLEQALHSEQEHEAVIGERLLGLQANTSAKPPEELDGSACLESQAPDVFASAMMRLHTRFRLKALGGCCGTDDRHIARIAQHADKQINTTP
jgi:S-methylmethionine-dependent homocysteine/selenocysteine methylase